MSRRPIWMERPRLVERLAQGLILSLVVLLVVYPFAEIVSTSLAGQADVDAGGGLVLLPLHPTLRAYQVVFEGGAVTRAILISVGVTVVGTLASLATTVAMAYALSRPILGSRQILRMALLTLFFAPGIIPSYLVVKQLGLLNTYASLVLPVLLNAFNLVVVRQFFMAVPEELVDSARLDGAGDLAILLRIVLPLSKAAVAVIGLFYAVGYWNAFFNALLYLNDQSRWPLQLILRLYVIQGAPLPGVGSYVTGQAPPPPESIQMAVVVIALLPIALVYPFLQRYFTKGVLSGAIKG